MQPGVIGFYWPIKGEFDLRSLVIYLINLGWEAALPVVIKKSNPLEFHQWEPDMKLVPGVWNIPIPAQKVLLEPTVLLIPLVGYDKEDYRLGYGAGYYDMTLSNLYEKPFSIGVGLEICKLDTIYPQQHDIPMDLIISAPI